MNNSKLCSITKMAIGVTAILAFVVVVSLIVGLLVGS